MGNGADCNLRRGGNGRNRGHRGQIRAGQFRHRSTVTRTLQLIDEWGNESIIQHEGQMNRIKHHKVLAVLERRALQYREGVGKRVLGVVERCDETIDETGTVQTAGLTEEGREGEAVRMEEILSAMGVQDEVLQVHGMAPGRKAEGVVRLIYENLDGMSNRITGNEKLEKEKGIIDDLEVDIVCLNEHKQNLMHKDNTNGFSL